MRTCWIRGGSKSKYSVLIRRDDSGTQTQRGKRATWQWRRDPSAQLQAKESRECWPPPEARRGPGSSYNLHRGLVLTTPGPWTSRLHNVERMHYWLLCSVFKPRSCILLEQPSETHIDMQTDVLDKTEIETRCFLRVGHWDLRWPSLQPCSAEAGVHAGQETWNPCWVLLLVEQSCHGPWLPQHIPAECTRLPSQLPPDLKWFLSLVTKAAS